MFVRGQIKSENSSLPVTVRVSKKGVLKFPNIAESGHSEVVCSVIEVEQLHLAEQF